MPGREKVIKGLECCTAELEINQHQEDFCAVCPYKDKDPASWYCFHKTDLMRDALAMLKAQEPRVMALEEAQGAEYCWFEHKSMKPVTVASVYMCYGKVTGKTASEIRRLGYSKVDLLLDEDYGISWRCWSAKPTDAQREREPWN